MSTKSPLVAIAGFASERLDVGTRAAAFCVPSSAADAVPVPRLLAVATDSILFSFRPRVPPRKERTGCLGNVVVLLKLYTTLSHGGAHRTPTAANAVAAVLTLIPFTPPSTRSSKHRRKTGAALQPPASISQPHVVLCA